MRESIKRRSPRAGRSSHNNDEILVRDAKRKDLPALLQIYNDAVLTSSTIPRGKPSYSWSAEESVYIRKGFYGRGMGSC